MVIENVPALKFLKELSNVNYIFRFSAFTGRIAIGRLERGVLKEGMPISLVKEMVLFQNLVLRTTYFEGLGRKVTEVIAGDICAIIGVGFEIGDTIADHETQKVLASIIDEPTMSMLLQLMILLSLEKRVNL
jgi:GTP-binding protein